MASEHSALLEGSGGNSTPKYGTNDRPPSISNGSSEAGGSNDIEQQKEESSRSYWAVVAPMAVGIFLSAMDGTIIVSSYASIGSELNELNNTSWIATSYLLTITSVHIVSIVVSDVVPLRYRGTWQGVLNMVFAVGNATGASLGGFFSDTIGWRWSFLLQVPVAIFAIISVSLSLHLPKIDSGDLVAKFKRIDFIGAVTLIITVFLLLVGLDRGGNIGWSDPYTRYALTGFVFFASFLVFIEFEWAREPFAPKRIIINRSLIASYLVNFFGIASAFTVLFHVPLYLQAVQSKTASQASLSLIYSVVAAMAGSLGGGLIMQSTGKYYWLTFWSNVLLVVGIGALTLSSGIIVSSALSITLGTSITTSLISLIANAGQEDQAIATAVSYLFRSLGSVVGLSLGSTIVQITLRSTLRARLSGDSDSDIEEIVRRVRESLTYLDELDEATRAIVRGSYEVAIQATFVFATIVAALALVSSMYIKEKPLPSRK
ncbi:membrane transporter [Coprinopsis cinerea okayama7|uniref:Membrane transporter n=1 Tax=Coprinopsis cinerea (strain Okayama-7 / 130 / ATCC MYA-4618 / FGSC 9003) TaxID=240176 RepID=A8P941_COPC7|nr:membrane transporter [Coprinopsis cinerea okayama7\|eukprot:XP_001839691.2 membrane transporter [Coprinopsis cinerea okayama7\